MANSRFPSVSSGQALDSAVSVAPAALGMTEVSERVLVHDLNQHGRSAARERRVTSVDCRD